MNALTRRTLSSITAAVAIAGAAAPGLVGTPAQASPAHHTTTTWTGGNPRTLRPGTRNVEVRALQVHLSWLGYFTATPTGYYGSVTRNAVKAYQRHLGLRATGIADVRTLDALNGHLRWDLNFGRVQSARHTAKGWTMTISQVVICIPGDTERLCRGTVLGGAKQYDDMDSGTTKTLVVPAKATVKLVHPNRHPLVQVKYDAKGHITSVVEQYRP